MRPELEEIHVLEDFLHGQLPEEAAIEIEIRLLWDQAWKNKVELQRLSYQAIREAGRQQLRQELNTMHQKLFGR